MIEYQLFTYKESTICLFENTFTSGELAAELDLPDYYLNEYEELKTEKRRKEYLGLRLALKQCANGLCKQVIYTSEFKPEVIDKSLNISFSHSRNWIAVMAHPSKSVGIDIEVPSDKFGKIFHKFLNEKEHNDFDNGKNEEQLRLIWSAKEVLFKIIGNDAVNFSEQLRIFPFEVSKQGEFAAEHIPTGKKYILNYQLTDLYALVFCVDDEIS